MYMYYVIYIYYIIYTLNKPPLFPSGQIMTNHPDLLETCLFSFVDATVFLLGIGFSWRLVISEICFLEEF